MIKNKMNAFIYRFIISFITKIKYLFHTFCEYAKTPEILYKIDELDIEANQVTLHYYGSRAILKMSISHVINDEEIIGNLSSIQACWIGYNYSKYFSKIRQKNINFSLHVKKGRYKIISSERSGEIKYFDLKTRKEFQEHPINIVQNISVIEQFDPTQACYIGMLAGRTSEKTTCLRPYVNKTILRLVKS